jgi:hypothetical protein
MWRQTTLPLRIEIAVMIPRKLPMYATPSATEAGNSISDLRPRLQTTWNGGRRWMSVCAWVRASSAP